MSHEVRTPLGAIMGFSDLMKTSDLNQDDLRMFLSVIDRNAGHLLRIIDDILDLSKVEAGKMLFEDIAFSLPDLLAEFASPMAFKAREKGIEFEITIQNKIPEIVCSDPTRIRQILNNMVGNAVKFTDNGSVHLEVSAINNLIEFKVTDTGPGISKDQAQRLFQPFQQADVSTTRRYGGTGLGLSLIRRLAEAMGGVFYLEKSELGKGSVFVCRVRVKITDSSHLVDNKVKIPLQRTPDKESLKGLKVLVVDDAQDNQTLLRLTLSKLGAKVTTADDGYKAIELALNNDYDVVLMDIQMPRMDGYQATSQLRDSGYDQPIIALTAHAMKDQRERAVQTGFTGFLSKPINRDALIEKLKVYHNAKNKEDFLNDLNMTVSDHSRPSSRH
jgi:CheY-like chemotaxis protein